MKRARNLPGKDDNGEFVRPFVPRVPIAEHLGLSDPYCKVSVANRSQKGNEMQEVGSSSSSLTPPPSPPSRPKRTPSLLSCISTQCGWNAFVCFTKRKSVLSAGSHRLKPPSRNGSRRSSRSSGRRPSTDYSSTVSSDKSRGSSTISYRTEMRPKTLNPEWNERFELSVRSARKRKGEFAPRTFFFFFFF